METPQHTPEQVKRSIRDLKVRLLVQDILYGNCHEQAEAEAKLKELEKE